MLEGIRCKLFEDLSEQVWDSICKAHNVKIDKKEEDITADLIIEILTFSKNNVSNFDVYAKPGYKGNVNGSDIDIYVETSKNQYRRFALQAKVLKKNNRYNTLRDGCSKTNPNYQWDKLKKLEKNNSCKGYFLLYNGKDNYIYTGTDCIGVSFNEKQFGCSLVELDEIKKFGLKKGPNGNFIKFGFRRYSPEPRITIEKVSMLLS